MCSSDLDCGFLRNAEKRPSMVRNIRNLFQRTGLTHQEIRTLHGIVAELATYRQRRRKAGSETAAARGEQEPAARRDPPAPRGKGNRA